MEVVGPGFSDFITPTELEASAEGVVAGNCGLRGAPGEALQQNGCHGLPLATALGRLGVTSFGYLTLPRTNGTTAYLSAEAIENPTAAFEGGVPPILFVDQLATRFYRPPKIGDPEDVNAEDNIATVSGEALVVGVHEGHVVEVQVTPSTTSTTSGGAVQFTAAASGGEEGETFTYVWSFGDGTTATTVGSEAVSHAFSGSGTFQVRATATGTAGSGGESGPVGVVVGNPPTTETPGATTTPQPPTAKPTGAPGKGREGRGGEGPKPAPSGGKKPKRERNSKDGAAVQRAASPPDRSDRSPEPSAPAPSPPSSPLPETAIPLPPEAPAVPPPTLEEPSGGASAEPPGCCSAEAPPDGSPAPTLSQGELIEGRLVGDDLGPTTLEEAVGGSAGGEGSRSAAGAVGGAGIGAPVGALIVVALLAGGALSEWRRSRPGR